MKAGLTAERVRELLAYDAVTGELRWRVSRSKGKCGEPAGRIDAGGYREIGIDGKLVKAHRLAWLIAHGDIGGGLVIDHINGNRSDNRPTNLRAVTPAENGRNRHQPAGNNSAVGITWDKARQKWRADIKIGNKCVTLGRFDVHEQAAAAHAKAKALHHGIGTCSAPAVPKSEAA